MKQNNQTVRRCPVCNGNGLVSNGFYNQTSGLWSSSGTAFEKCRSCDGQGFVTLRRKENAE